MHRCASQVQLVGVQVDAAATRVRDSVLSTAEAEGLTYQSYWLSATLALGAFLKVTSACLCLHHLHVRPGQAV